MGEYNLTNVIVIQMLTQPHTCERGYLIFSTMSRLKFVSMNSFSLLSMSYTEITDGEKMFPFFETVLTVFIFLFLVSLVQEIYSWFISVGVCIRV